MFNKIFKPFEKIQSLSGVRKQNSRASSSKKDFEDFLGRIFVSNDEVQLEDLFHKNLSYYRNVLKLNYVLFEYAY